MVFDRRTTYGLVQALLRARNKKDGSDDLENVAQANRASLDPSYGGGAFGGTRFSSASQPGGTTDDNAASQSHKLITMPRPHPFPAAFLYTGEVTDMAEARGIPAHDQLAFKTAPGTLSRPANPQASYGRPLEVNGVYSTEPKPTGGRPAGKALRLNMYPATDVSRARPVTLVPQIGFGGTGTYQSPEDARKELNDPGVHIDTLRRQSWGHDGTAKTTPPGHRPATLRLADGEPEMAKEAPHQEKKMPKIRYPTSGEIWSEFLGGIGKGIAQTFSDIVAEDAKARLATVDGIYVDTPNPDLFGPPTSPWDNTGRKIAPGIMVVVRPVPRRSKTWNGKIIGKVTPPKDLKPGTVPFGNYMHEQIAEFLKASYPKTNFDIRVKPGQKGPDMGYKGGGLDPGFKILDIKANKPHSQRELNRQIQNWGYEESTVRAISYDEKGNIYDGFGY